MILLLSLLEKPQNEVRLSALDFAASYGKEFHISHASLSGDNPLCPGSFPGRAHLCSEALDILIETGYAGRILTPGGIGYRLTASGKEAAEKLASSPYGAQYKKTAETAARVLQEEGDASLIRRIFQKPKENPS